MIKPNYDINSINVPVGFYPSKKIIEEKISEKTIQEINILDEIIKIIADKSTLNREEIENKIKTIVKEKNITSEVAALLIGKDYEINLDKYYEKVEKEIFT